MTLSSFTSPTQTELLGTANSATCGVPNSPVAVNARFTPVLLVFAIYVAVSATPHSDGGQAFKSVDVDNNQSNILLNKLG